MTTSAEADALRPYAARFLRPRMFSIPFPGVYRPQRREGSAWTFPGLDALAIAYAEQGKLRHFRRSGRVSWYELVDRLRIHVMEGRHETIVHGWVSDRVLAMFPVESIRADEYVFRGNVVLGEPLEILHGRIPYLDTKHAEGRAIPRLEDIPQWSWVRKDSDAACGPQWWLVPDTEQ